MKKLQILLTNPCQENWDDMQPSKVGRYCETCTKHIVDLTAKSDKEILEFFKRKKDNVCARLTTTQLHRDLIAFSPQKMDWKWLFPLALGSSFFVPSNATAQLKLVTLQSNEPSVALKPTLIENPKSDTIRGKVIDQSTGEPLEGVHITRKSYKNVIAKTDSNGNYVLSMKIEERIYPLVFTHIDYNTTEQSVASEMNIKLSKAPRIMLGGAHVVDVTNQPLYIVNAGKKSCTLKDSQDLQAINLQWIENLEIVNHAAATAIYGAKGKNGVIIVTIKEEHFDKLKFSKKKK